MVAGKLLVSLIRPGEGRLNILLLCKGNDLRLPCADRCAEARVTSDKEKNTASRRPWSLRENGLTVLPQTSTRIQEPSDPRILQKDMQRQRNCPQEWKGF